MGWMGTMQQVKHYLETVGADRDAAGNFLLVGPPGSEPVTFMGDTSPNAETVLDEHVCYLVKGERKALAAGLSSTSMGLGGIKVI
jgi:hypothetical protein